MTEILVKIDCDGKKCGPCEYARLGVLGIECALFCDDQGRGKNGEIKRLPACLAAESSAQRAASPELMEAYRGLKDVAEVALKELAHYKNIRLETEDMLSSALARVEAEERKAKEGK